MIEIKTRTDKARVFFHMISILRASLPFWFKISQLKKLTFISRENKNMKGIKLLAKIDTIYFFTKLPGCSRSRFSGFYIYSFCVPSIFPKHVSIYIFNLYKYVQICSQ